MMKRTLSSLFILFFREDKSFPGNSFYLGFVMKGYHEKGRKKIQEKHFADNLLSSLDVFI